MDKSIILTHEDNYILEFIFKANNSLAMQITHNDESVTATLIDNLEYASLIQIADLTAFIKGSYDELYSTNRLSVKNLGAIYGN